MAFFLLNQINGQTKNQLDDMIISSLNSFTAESNAFVKQGIVIADTIHHYILKDGLPLIFPYSSLKNVTFFSLENMEGLPNSFKKNRIKG